MLDLVRICGCCGKSFKPEVGRQLFCSPECRKKRTNEVRRRRRNFDSVGASEARNVSILESKAFLSISEASVYLGVSRPTIYSRIAAGDYHPVYVTSRTIRIPMEEILASKPHVKENIDYSKLITLEEAVKKYGMSKSTIYNKMSSAGLKSKRIGFVTYLPKNELDVLFTCGSIEYADITDWKKAEEIAADMKMSTKYVCDFARKNNLPRYKKNRFVYISLSAWEQARFLNQDDEAMTGKQAQKFYHIGANTFYDTVNSLNIERHRSGNEVFFRKSDLDKLFLDKSPKIPADILKNYMRSGDALKYYHVGQKRFSAETQAANVTKVKTEGNFVWYLKSDLDKLFKTI